MKGVTIFGMVIAAACFTLSLMTQTEAKTESLKFAMPPSTLADSAPEADPSDFKEETWSPFVYSLIKNRDARGKKNNPLTALDVNFSKSQRCCSKSNVKAACERFQDCYWKKPKDGKISGKCLSRHSTGC